MTRRVPRDAAFIVDRCVADPDTGCWNWTGSISVAGRAVYNAEYAYRIAYEILVGPLDGRQVNHHCDNPACVNPAHLYAGTQQQNIADCVARGRNFVPTAPKGEAHPLGHSDAVVAEIRRAVAAGELTKRQAAEKFGVDVKLVRLWLRGSRRGLAPLTSRDERFKAPAACGTRAGYCRHRREGTPYCQPCREANSDYMRAYKAKRYSELRSAA